MGENIFLIIANLVFVGVIIHSLSKRKDIILSAKIKDSKKITLAISSIAIIGIFIYLGNGWIHYITAILGTIAYVLSSLYDGLSEKGILTKVRIIIKEEPWESVSRIKIIENDYISLDFTGDKVSNIIYFEEEQYEELIAILDKKLSDELKTKINR